MWQFLSNRKFGARAWHYEVMCCCAELISVSVVLLLDEIECTNFPGHWPRVRRAPGYGPRSSRRGCRAGACPRGRTRPRGCCSTWAVLLYWVVPWLVFCYYPSATNTSPVDATATEVGLQKCVASFPGTNWVPRTRDGFFSPLPNFMTWWRPTSVTQVLPSWSIFNPCGM